MSGRTEDSYGFSVVSRAFLERLCEIAEGCDKRIYAVIDGARFGGLPSRLFAAKLSHRHLYRQIGAGAAVVLGGPWLVTLCMAPPMPVSQDTVEGSEEPTDEELAALAAKL
ncbi:hypothetical protein KX729_25760 [Rhizobium sp. XQZ8]|uniref:hypothetical protein n=1 Tax=Rhizobium populisoli TaxID=2859785 RepID=UPI001CA549B2|nr:hypothetical protein [Rhizobium populisoli]MBW6424859.1 hypothetical protein [Rhizobium populisoli]